LALIRRHDPDPDPNPDSLRESMVRHDIEARGLRDPRVLEAMRAVPRHLFLDDYSDRTAYEDHPLPIGEGQTISQPYMVALMAEAATLEAKDRVLEIGTGSGYGAAVLARLAGEVWSIERIDTLATSAGERLGELGVDNVHVIHADGSLGWPEAAPYDAIVVTAASGEEVPPALLDQLGEGGRLVIPVGPAGRQSLLRIVRHGDRFSEADICGVAFVPLLGGVVGEDQPGPSG
jgi:protein-L-isoaspartate(D-aspartate) O-methyltransferase